MDKFKLFSRFILCVNNNGTYFQWVADEQMFCVIAVTILCVLAWSLSNYHPGPELYMDTTTQLMMTQREDR